MTPTEKEPLKFLAKHLFFGVVAAITFGVLVLATLLGHRRQLRPANTRAPGLTATLLVSLTVTTLAFIGYVTDVFIRGGGR